MDDGTIAMVYRGVNNALPGHLGICRLDPEGRNVVANTRSGHFINRQSVRELNEFPDGCGDPRINRVGSVFYIWANGHNNAQLRRDRKRFGNDFAGQYIGGRQTVAFRTNDFRTFEYLGLYGPDEFNKNSFLLPDAIDVEGKSYFAFFHRLQYSIQVLLVPTLERLQKRDVWHSHVSNLSRFTFMSPKFSWEGVSTAGGWPGSVSGGAPPIRLRNSQLPSHLDRSRSYWLLFYNGSGSPRFGNIARDRRIGVALFTLKAEPDHYSQPFRIIARAPKALLVPQEAYEFDGPNGDVVFATGAVMSLDGNFVDVFYGSGDVVISKARFELATLLDYLVTFDGNGNLVPTDMAPPPSVCDY